MKAVILGMSSLSIGWYLANEAVFTVCLVCCFILYFELKNSPTQPAV